MFFLVFDELTDHALKVEVMPKTLTLGEAVPPKTRLIHAVPVFIASNTDPGISVRESHAATGGDG